MYSYITALEKKKKLKEAITKKKQEELVLKRKGENEASVEKESARKKLVIQITEEQIENADTELLEILKLQYSFQSKVVESEYSTQFSHLTEADNYKGTQDLENMKN